MIKRFSIPDYYGKSDFIIDFLRYRKQYPQYFYEDRIIDNCYGAHPDILWTGGRQVNYDKSFTSMNEILEQFSNFPEVELRHVCTNYFMTPSIINDYKTNYFMQHYLREQDKIIVANPMLIEYLRENYPKTPLIYSTTLNITDINEVNKITENNIYVMNYNYNNDDEYIKQLKNINNIEVLCAEPCMPNCPKRVEHYQHISKVMLGLASIEEFQCINDEEYKFCHEMLKLPTAITSERVDELAAMGIQYFKISGRILRVPAWLDVLVYYLVLPQYQNSVFLQLLDAWW